MWKVDDNNGKVCTYEMLVCISVKVLESDRSRLLKSEEGTVWKTLERTWIYSCSKFKTTLVKQCKWIDLSQWSRVSPKMLKKLIGDTHKFWEQWEEPYKMHWD